MSVALTIATTDYDHFRDFRLGLVRAEGIAATWLTLGHHEIFSRFTFNREWDVSELSFAKFLAQVTRPDSDIIGLPVYASRLFRFASFYVNRKSGIKTVQDLRGKRIGVPEWAHTAAVYMRGWLMHECGVALSDIDWIQAGTNEAGRVEKVELSLPKGVRLVPILLLRVSGGEQLYGPTRCDSGLRGDRGPCRRCAGAGRAGLSRLHHRRPARRPRSAYALRSSLPVSRFPPAASLSISPRPIFRKKGVITICRLRSA